MPYFLKPFKILQSWERGNFDLGHHLSEEILFSLTTSFSDHRENRENQKIVKNGFSVQIL